MPTIPTAAQAKLAADVQHILIPIVGEQQQSFVDDDGDIHIDLMLAAVPMKMLVEPLGSEDAVVAGIHILGACIEDEDAAGIWVARHNSRIRFGKAVVMGDAVVFVHHLFASSVNEESIRHLIGLLLSESRAHPDLAAATGALSLVDAAALDALED